MTNLFGWCMPLDGNHEKCKTEVTSTLTMQTRRCGCTCHKREETP